MNFAVIVNPNYFDGHLPVQTVQVFAVCETQDYARAIIAAQTPEQFLSHGQYAPTSYDIKPIVAFAYDGDLEEPALDWLAQGASEDDANEYDKVANALCFGDIEGWLPVAVAYDSQLFGVVGVKVARYAA